jgi:glycosyltransferase involved in cell wall biosynthesis
VSAERRRILYVQPNSEIGGSDLVLLRTVAALDRDRFDPIVVLPQEGPLAPRLREAGAKVRLLPMMQLRTLPSVSYQARYLARFWPTVARLSGIIREEKAALVHSNSLYSLYGAFAALAARTPHLWHIREIPPAIPIARPALGRMVLTLSRMVVVMTRACSDGLFGAQARSGKIRFLAEGLDLATWSREKINRSIRGELGIAPETPLVGFVARLDPWKGLDVFLEAAALVRVRFPDAVFLVAGDAPAGFEAYRDRMIARSVELGLRERVHFLGWRYRLDDIPALMQTLDVFSHTALEPEPFGLVLIEAMAMGCPVVAARAGGPLEIIEDGVSGSLARVGDARAHADAICELLADPDRRRQIAAAGRARVEQNFSLHAFKHQLGRLYDEALG